MAESKLQPGEVRGLLHPSPPRAREHARISQHLTLQLFSGDYFQQMTPTRRRGSVWHGMAVRNRGAITWLGTAASVYMLLGAFSTINSFKPFAFDEHEPRRYCDGHVYSVGCVSSCPFVSNPRWCLFSNVAYAAFDERLLQSCPLANPIK
jgi:hypothetical protein